MLEAVLIDVGGTLWPNAWPSDAADHDERVQRLVASCDIDERAAAELVDRISLPEHPPGEEQQTASLIIGALQGREIDPAIVWTAMCLSPGGRIEPFDGAGELLASLRTAGLRVVIVSNVMWRDAAAHRRDFAALGWGDYVDAYVSSLEVGWRKPHPAFFAAVIEAAGCEPTACAMVGDSERNDIEPAHERGMLTIRVALEEPRPATSVADHVCTSLREVTRALTLLPRYEA